MNHRPLSPSPLFSSHTYTYLFLSLLLVRLLTAFFLPVIDPSEARYAEIARKLVELNDWVTLYHDYGVPFWAKPPLSTWFSSLGILLLGENAFATRIPLLFVSLGIIGLVVHFAQTEKQPDLPQISGLILFSGGLFYIASALVMTDMPFIFGLTLSMVSFWYALTKEKAWGWGYLFFVGQALSLLGKGLIGPALTALPLFFWILTKGNLKETWQKLPWISGTFLMLLIALPWYILAEVKTPGFLNYFIMGEHIYRFLSKGWAGDLYGSAHPQSWGMIWVFWGICFIPWSFWFGGLLFSKFTTWKTTFFPNNWIFYLWLWALAPLVFFTFSGNIIQTYVLPCLPAFSILLAFFIHQSLAAKPYLKKAFVFSVLIAPLLMLGFVFYSFYVPELLNNQKRLVEEFSATPKEAPLVYHCSNCYSAAFYSKGKIPLVLHEEKLLHLLARGPLYVAIRVRLFQTLSQETRSHLQEVGRYGTTILFKNNSFP